MRLCLSPQSAVHQASGMRRRPLLRTWPQHVFLMYTPCLRMSQPTSIALRWPVPATLRVLRMGAMTAEWDAGEFAAIDELRVVCAYVDGTSHSPVPFGAMVCTSVLTTSFFSAGCVVVFVFAPLAGFIYFA